MVLAIRIDTTLTLLDRSDACRQPFRGRSLIPNLLARGPLRICNLRGVTIPAHLSVGKAYLCRYRKVLSKKPAIRISWAPNSPGRRETPSKFRFLLLSLHRSFVDPMLTARAWESVLKAAIYLPSQVTSFFTAFEASGMSNVTNSRMPFDVLTTTAADLRSRLENGSLTSVQIVETYLAQIERHNRAGANLRLILSTPPRQKLVENAQELDKERAAGHVRGPLHGIPIILKVG
jgi:hypothetical protein